MEGSWSNIGGLGLARDNVFIDAYAARGGAEAYSQFLKDVAPFEDEDQLERFLVGRGIQVVVPRPTGDDERGRHNRIRISLHREYDREERGGDKASILVDDEALQLWMLDHEARQGRRAVFITMDRRLRRLMVTPEFANLSGLVLSPLSLIQLVDLLVGVKPEGKSFARIMWPVRSVTGANHLRDYLVDKGLAYYFEEAYAKGVPELVGVVNQLMRGVEERARQGEVKFEPVTASEVKRTLDLVEEIEDGFYEGMAKEIRKRNEGEG